MPGARPRTGAPAFPLHCRLSADGCCAVAQRSALWQRRSANLGSFLGWDGPEGLGGTLFLAASAARKLQRWYNPCWQTFSEVSELQVNNTHTRAIAQEPLPRALLEILCRLMRQRSPGLQVGFVCSFPTFLQVILQPWLLCMLEVRFKGPVCSQPAKDECWVHDSLGQADLLLKIKSGKQNPEQALKLS